MKIVTRIAGRLVKAAIVLLAILVLNFLLIHAAPGDPAAVMAGEAGATDEIFLSQLREKFGLDQPLYIQLGKYVADVARPRILRLGLAGILLVRIVLVFALRLLFLLVLTPIRILRLPGIVSRIPARVGAARMVVVFLLRARPTAPARRLVFVLVAGRHAHPRILARGLRLARHAAED